METSSQPKRQRKFNPPLKTALTVPAGGTSQDSYCSSSWSLPPTQTHTVLSYCEQDVDDQVAAAQDLAQKREGGVLKKTLRNYNYGVQAITKSRKPTEHATKSRKPTEHATKSRKPTEHVTKTSAGTGTDVYDYYLTPSKQVQQRRHSARSKEQVRHMDFWGNYYSANIIFTRLKLTREFCSTLQC